MSNPNVGQSASRVVDQNPIISTWVGIILFLMPTCLLALGIALVETKAARGWLIVGLAVELIGLLWWAYGSPLEQRSRFLPVGVFSLVAVVWLWLAPPDPLWSWFVPLCMGLLLLGPSILFAREFQRQAGLLDLMHAHRAIHRIQKRTLWPRSPEDIRALAEVRSLRDSIQLDSAPVWVLLHSKQIEQRLVGLAALEYRERWLPGRAEAIYHYFTRVDDPHERAAALRALGGLEHSQLSDLHRRMIHDPSRPVRRAALEIVLRKAHRHWGRYRTAIHSLLRDPRFADDGPLGEGLSVGLPPAAVSDLTTWAGEMGPTSLRATLALIAHFKRLLNEQPGAELIHMLRGCLFDSKVPTIVRVELAHLLRAEDALDQEMILVLLGPTQPSGLRILAAESLLRDNPRHEDACTVLREVARQPNRELSLSIAWIIQRYLSVDMGLPWNGRLPSAYSREAADVTRRVMNWARETDPSAPQRAAQTSWSLELPPPPLPRPNNSEWDF